MNVTTVDTDTAATEKDAAIVNMTGMILYRMHQNWEPGSELGLAW